MPETVTFDHYEVLTRDDGSLYELGRGAMGITYKAFDTNLRIPVALKVINATFLNSEVARQRFIREARSAAKLRHRNVASVFHLGIENDAYFYAMEFIDGETVDALIKRQGAISPFAALQIAAQVARALNAAQPHGLVHRDIKPANLMLVREDEELAVKVIDFGLAKSSVPGEAEEDSGTSTMAGFVGTPHFASPEQLDEKEIDVRSDIYSLGVTLWYMIAGQTPFVGSMAQVMSQHLSKAPPFEQLAGIPPALTTLLGRMLDKDPSRRPQTPAEVRREIEECMEKLKASASSGATPINAQQNLSAIFKESAAADKPGEVFESGAIVAARYRIVRDLGETNTGHLFHAEQLASQRDVRLLVLNHELAGETATYTQIEREVGRAMAAAHPNLLQIHSIETVGRDSFIVSEWTNGFSLLELLRARRELRATELLALLPQAANGIDHAARAGLRRLDLELHQVFVHFGGAPVTKEELLRQPVEGWPEFSLKLNPLGITRELSASETWAGRQTIVGGLSASASHDENAPPRYIQALAAIVYELLGGTLTPFALKAGGTHRYTPIATLSEEGNNVLQRALDPTAPFATAHDFYSALSGVDGLEVERHETKMVSPPQLNVVRRPARPVTVTSQPRRQKMPVKFVGGLMTVAVLAGAIYFFGLPLAEKKRDDRVSTTPPSSPKKTEEPATIPNPEPVPVPLSSPASPSREERLRVATAEADALEAKKDWPASIIAWMRIAKDYPEGMGKVRLELLFEELRTNLEETNARELPRLRELAVEAAQLDVLTAMTFLGKSLRETDPTGSLNWYSAAAARDVDALLQLGVLLKERGDLPEAFACFQGASEQGNLDAKNYLAECYLEGRGVSQNEKRGVEILREAVDRQSLWAMDRLGICYRKSSGVEQNFAEAFRLFTTASQLGYAPSTGNLGILHMNGEGVPKDPERAVAYFREGSAAGDPTGTCMYYYAKCFETGSGLPRPDPVKAREWYVKAAELGNKTANDWCRKRKLSVTPKKQGRGSTPE